MADYIIYATSAIGGLTLLVRGLTELAKLTETEKDDAVLAKVGKYLDKAADLLHKVTPEARPK